MLDSVMALSFRSSCALPVLPLRAKTNRAKHHFVQTFVMTMRQKERRGWSRFNGGAIIRCTFSLDGTVPDSSHGWADWIPISLSDPF
jgi:hypothetical protein